MCGLVRGQSYRRRGWRGVRGCSCRCRDRLEDPARDPREPHRPIVVFDPVDTWLGRYMARIVARAVGVRSFDRVHYGSRSADSFDRPMATFLPEAYAHLVNAAVPYLEGFSLYVARRSIAYAARRLADPRCARQLGAMLARDSFDAFEWIARIARRHPGAGHDVFPMFASPEARDDGGGL